MIADEFAVTDDKTLRSVNGREGFLAVPPRHCHSRRSQGWAALGRGWLCVTLFLQQHYVTQR